MYSASQGALGQKAAKQHYKFFFLTRCIFVSTLSLGSVALLPKTGLGCSVVHGPVILINTLPARRIWLFCGMLSPPPCWAKAQLRTSRVQNVPASLLTHERTLLLSRGIFAALCHPGYCRVGDGRQDPQDKPWRHREGNGEPDRRVR